MIQLVCFLLSLANGPHNGYHFLQMVVDVWLDYYHHQGGYVIAGVYVLGCWQIHLNL